ncbi:MAG: TonB-dependent receptor [Lysobacterales bacterium]
MSGSTQTPDRTPAPRAEASKAQNDKQSKVERTPRLAAVTVTGTREAKALAETPSSVGLIDGLTIQQDKPSHPAQLVSQVPGVAVAVTNGEGHTTSIRQPFTTSPVYLFLEDGIPTRATGFFNHNGLYEIDIPQAGGIEITRGPGTALYGSDAIGGIINVLTRPAGERTQFDGSLEIGDNGWTRGLAGASLPYANGGLRADVNITHTDGWRASTAYDRQSGIVRWDHQIDADTRVQTNFGFSIIDQETGANSPLTRTDFENNPRDNYLPIAFRKVDAYRLNSTLERSAGNSLFSITGLYRDNSMDLLASFALNNDPTLSSVQNKSYGVLSKWRYDLPDFHRATLIVGLDYDRSPGGRNEDRVQVTPVGSGASRRFESFTLGPRVYDYDVTYRGISPYVHAEISPLERLRLTAGLRYDDLRYRFDNAFDPLPLRVVSPFPGTRFFGQVADTSVSFDRFSPKFAATFELTPHAHVYTSWNHSFRAPSEGQLFRPSAGTSADAAQALADSAVSLKPIKAEQIEFGLRGEAGAFNYDAVVYDLRKTDDIVSLRDNLTNFVQSVNAGKTKHRGVEVGSGAAINDRWRVDTAYSYAKHTYQVWNTSAGNFTGNEIESAPRTLINSRLTWNPLPDTRVQFEWVRIGSYWLDAANTEKYGGHDVFNLRGNWRFSDNFALFASISNLANKRYADSAQIRSGEPVFSPALPRTYVGGIEVTF